MYALYLISPSGKSHIELTRVHTTTDITTAIQTKLGVDEHAHTWNSSICHPAVDSVYCAFTAVTRYSDRRLYSCVFGTQATYSDGLPQV
jgi:hypothetical protein